MRNRRVVLLVAVLAALNTALWLVPQGLALRVVSVPSLFGKRMVRADAVVTNGSGFQEWRVDRGIVVSNVPGLITLQEADKKIQPIVTSSATTKTTFNGISIRLKNVKPGWHVLVTWPARNGPADSVVVERRGSSS
jgi:hypothetical protein